ncbi:hypothetical protein QBE52_14570 [Clostridiaceae bacterium 35-E11]
MKTRKEIHKKIINGRLLKSYGSWMYCNNCNKTVGYLCYTTYLYFRFSFICNCGSKGSFELGKMLVSDLSSEEDLVLNKNRLCCAIDGAPLFSIVEKNIKEYSYEVVCNKCFTRYLKK